MDDTRKDRALDEQYIGDGDDNRVVQVTVFLDKALVTRRARAAVRAGLNRLAMEVHALDLDADSAQARVYGDGEILSVQYLSEPVKEMPQAELRELDEKKRGLTRDRNTMEKERDGLTKQRRYLDSVVGFAEVQVPREIKTEFPSTERLQSVLGFLGSSYEAIGRAEKALEERIEDLERELRVVERRLKRVRREREADRKVIEVLFNAAGDQTVEIEAAYLVAQAGWAPVYKVDAPADLSGVNLTLFSRIVQRSGEPWREVNLTLSNAVPLHSTELPEAHTWTLRPPAPVRYGAARVPAEAMPMAAAEPVAVEAGLDEMVGEGDLEEAAFVQSEARELPLAFEYDFPQTVRLESGDKETLLPLFTRRLAGEFFHYAVPRSDPLVYLVCRTAPDSTLLAGRLNIHFSGRFIGSTRLGEKRVGEDLLINLGAERGVKVIREKISDTRTETFFGRVDRNSVAREMRFRLEVENLKDAPVRVQLLDSLPVSETDRFQVKGLEMKPPPTEEHWRQRRGVMRWDLEVPARDTREVAIHIAVKHPKDLVPDGL